MAIQPPLLVISDTDKGGVLVVHVAFSLCILLTSFGVRVHAKRRTWKVDDWLILGATILSVVRSGITFGEVSRGRGKSLDLLDEKAVMRLEKTIFVGNIFYFLAMICSKLAMVFLIGRLTKLRKQGAVLGSLIAGIVAWGIVAILLFAINCYPAVIFPKLCPNLFIRWLILGIWDMLSEVIIFATAMFYLLPMTSSHRRASFIVSVFAIRLPIIAAAGLRLYFIHSGLGTNKVTLFAAYTAICTQIEIDYGIISSNLMCLKPLVTPYQTEMVYTTKAGTEKRSSVTYDSIKSVRRSMQLEEMPDLWKESIMGSK